MSKKARTTRRRRPAPKTAPRPPLPEAPSPESFAGWEAAMSPREHRIDQIVDKMMAGAWLSGVSDKAWAKDWNVSPNTVRKMAAEASRIVRFRMRDDPEAKAEARALMLQTFQVILAKSMAKGDSPSLRVALDAARAYGFYLGIEPAKRLDIADRSDPFEGWSTSEKMEFAESGRRPRHAIRALAASLESESNGAGSLDGGDAEPFH